MSLSNLEVVQNLYAAFAANDGPTIMASLAPDLVWNEAEGFPYADHNPYNGPAAVGEGVFYRLATEWDYFHVIAEKFIDAGNTILMTGRYKAAYKATGRILDAQVAHVWQLRDGKAISFQQYTDTAQAVVKP